MLTKAVEVSGKDFVYFITRPIIPLQVLHEFNILKTPFSFSFISFSLAANPQFALSGGESLMIYRL